MEFNDFTLLIDWETDLSRVTPRSFMANYESEVMFLHSICNDFPYSLR